MNLWRAGACPRFHKPRLAGAVWIRQKPRVTGTPPSIVRRIRRRLHLKSEISNLKSFSQPHAPNLSKRSYETMDSDGPHRTCRRRFLHLKSEISNFKFPAP
jgi:hypothetical protein